MDSVFTRPVLDHGFVELLEWMGGDSGIIRAARVSYAGTSKGDEKDKKLIEYLLKHNHFTPFEHALLKFHVKCPIFVARQWFRHRFAAYNEISFRYTQTSDEFYVPTKWRGQDTKNKQGSVSIDLDHEKLSHDFGNACQKAFLSYKVMLEQGVAREMARMVLPVNLYTEFYWTVNARSLMNFLSLRADGHAQWEIQQFAEVVNEAFKNTMPWTHEAFLSNIWKGDNQILDEQKIEAQKAKPIA